MSMTSAAATGRVYLRFAPEDHALLEQEAADAGVPLSALIWARALGRPLSERPRVGRPPKHRPTQEEELFPMTG
ncbi:hypothetical protein ACIA03_29085 [Nocardioides sp. NPDC051685]|uniref:hypothetical protein n=1 Tax=Nocardioides sp. NPDC051685 TaxID=3364334 RepID=UPI0037A24F8D